MLHTARITGGPIDRIVPPRPLHPFAEDALLPPTGRRKAGRETSGSSGGSVRPASVALPAAGSAYTPQGAKRMPAPPAGALLDVRV